MLLYKNYKRQEASLQNLCSIGKLQIINEVQKLEKNRISQKITSLQDYVKILLLYSDFQLYLQW